jgi:hypothetical protein
MTNENIFLSEGKYLQKKKIMTSSLQNKDNLIKSENNTIIKQTNENIDLNSRENEKYSKSIVS